MTDAGLPVGPVRPSAAVSAGAAVATALVVGTTGAPAFALSGLGLASLAVGLRYRSRPAVTAALCLLWLAIVIAALAGLPPEAVGVALVAAVLAWDAAHRGLTLGAHLTTRAATARIEGIHALGTLAVGFAGFGIAYALSWFVGGVGAPATVLAFALAVGLLAYAVESSGR